MSRILETRRAHLGVDGSPLGFESSGTETWPKWNRYLTLNGKRAYEIGNICSTCSFFFERMSGANSSVDFNAHRVEQLAGGIDTLDSKLIDELGTMLPPREFDVSLMSLVPRAIQVGSIDDYFVTEQQETWGVDGFWGFPHHPKIPYYRLQEQALGAEERLFEFVIPMYPQTWLNSERVESYRAALRDHRTPTAVVMSILDVKEHYDEPGSHWCLAHYVIDGHHKIEASNLEGRPLNVVSFLARNEGISSEEQLDKVLKYLASPAAR